MMNATTAGFVNVSSSSSNLTGTGQYITASPQPWEFLGRSFPPAWNNGPVVGYRFPEASPVPESAEEWLRRRVREVQWQAA